MSDPDPATTAAAAAIIACPYPKVGEGTARNFAAAALGAARPLIVEAERQRIRDGIETELTRLAGRHESPEAFEALFRVIYDLLGDDGDA